MAPLKLTNLKQQLRSLLPKRKAAGDAVSDAGGADKTAARPSAIHLSIMFSDADWRLTLVNTDNGGTAETRQGTLVDSTSMAAAAGGAVEGLRAALKSLAPGEKTLIETVVLHPAGSSIEIFDNRSIRAFSPDTESLRAIADDLTGSADSAVDSTTFGDGDDVGDGEHRLVAVCRIELLRRYITALGELAPKLTAIDPEFVREIRSRAQSGPQAIAYIGAHITIFCAFDPDNGVFAMRTAPVGIAAFAALVADTNSLPFPEAIQEMANRDMVARAVAAGMDGPLNQITDLIRETLQYVAESRVADNAATIQVGGPIDAVHGLIGLLQDRLEMPAVALAPSAFAPDLTPNAEYIGMNLLKSAVGPVFTEGAREYIYDGKRFVGHETARRKEASVNQKKTKQKPAVRKFAGIEMGGLSGELTPKRLAGIAACGAGALLFIAYDLLIAPKAKALEVSTSRLQAEQISAQTLTGQLIKLRSSARRDALAAAGVDKLLWAEKFVSIGRALPPSLWLTEAAIRSDNRRVGQVEVVTTKLALTGIARSTGHRRLQDIAAFIKALEADADFMRDFREITFAGLGGEALEATFEIHAWYDENKRRENPADSAESTNPLTAATNAAAARRRATPGPAEGFVR